MYDIEDAVIKNLKDAGCDVEMIQEFTEKLRKGNTSEGIHLLELHRRFLLDSLHTEQLKIDCLDYLLYQLKKQNRSPATALK